MGLLNMSGPTVNCVGSETLPRKETYLRAEPKCVSEESRVDSKRKYSRPASSPAGLLRLSVPVAEVSVNLYLRTKPPIRM